MNARLNMISRTVLVLLAVVVTCGLAPQEDPVAVKAKAKIGEKAPSFTLLDSKGQERSLETYKDKIVVLEWTNPDCPVVQDLYRRKVMAATFKQVRDLDKNVVWIAINSSAGSAERSMDFWISQHQIKYPLLIDADGKVGKSYGALRTPHMFVIDGSGLLRYHGAIDDNRLGSKPLDKVRNYVVDTVRQIVNEDEVSPDHVKPYGCMVKYRP